MPSSSRSPEIERAYDHLDDVETQVSGSVPDSYERLEALRASIKEYETLEAASDQRELLDRIDEEIDDLREAIEREVEEGADTAHDALEKVTQRVSELRDGLDS